MSSDSSTTLDNSPGARRRGKVMARAEDDDEDDEDDGLMIHHSLLPPVLESTPSSSLEYLGTCPSDHTTTSEQHKSAGSGYSTPNPDHGADNSNWQRPQRDGVPLPVPAAPASPFAEADEDNYTDFVLSDEEGVGAGPMSDDDGAEVEGDVTLTEDMMIVDDLEETTVRYDEEETPLEKVPDVGGGGGGGGDNDDDCGGQEDEEVDEGGYADDESEFGNEEGKGRNRSILRHATFAASAAAALLRTPGSGSRNANNAATPSSSLTTDNLVDQEGQIAALMVDDKPWRGRRRRHHRRSTKGNTAPADDDVLRVEVEGQDQQQQHQEQEQDQKLQQHPQQQQSPFPPPLFRYIRAWGSRERGHVEDASSETLPPMTETALEDCDSGIQPEDHQAAAAVAAVEDFSSDETSYGEEISMESWDLDGEEGKFGWEEPVDWSSMPVLPNRFCAASQPAAPSGSRRAGGSGASFYCYLDSMLMSRNLTELEGNRFVWEHGVLLQAVLQLLAERDQVGVEGSVELNSNIYKKGPLKKLAPYPGVAVVGRRGKRPAPTNWNWKVKYVELRRGNLCYYEDSGHSSTQGRKTVHLRQADTTVQNSNVGSHRGFVFELNVIGSPTLLWMASSEEERQAWTRAIQAAMIGDEETRRVLDLAPHQRALNAYTRLRERLQEVDTQETYMEAINSVVQDENEVSLQIPVQWVRQQIQKQTGSSGLDPLKVPASSSRAPLLPHKRLKTSIDAFWKTLGQTTISINGLTIPRESPVAPARIMGSLSRCIIEYDRAFCSASVEDDDMGIGLPMLQECGSGGSGNSKSNSTLISELQAVAYARNILMTVLRNKEQQDAFSAVNYLLKNPELVAVDISPPAGSLLAHDYAAADGDPLIQMEVSFAGEDLGTVPDYDSQEALADDNEMVGWVWTRRKNYATSKWRQRHFVLSGGVLNYYEAAAPRPHGLQGQLVLSGATVKPEETGEAGGGVLGGEQHRFVLCVMTQEQERLLSFKSDDECGAWKEAIQVAIDSCACGMTTSAATAVCTDDCGAVGTTAATSSSLATSVASQHHLENNKRGGKSSLLKGIKGAIPDGGIRVIRGAKDGGIKVIKSAKDGGIKVIRGAVGMLRHRNSEGNGDEQHPSTLSRRRPSMQMLMSNTAVLPGKRGPTVQCVVQATNTFWIKARNELDGPEEVWMSVRAKVFQAFLMSGGPSGRMAQGDALVELEFI